MNATNIIDNLNQISEKVFKFVEKEIYELLDKIVTIDLQIFNKEPLKLFFSKGIADSFIIIANALLIINIIYYIISILISMYNGKSVDNVNKFILKTISIGIIINYSYFICEEIIDCINNVTITIDYVSKHILNKELKFVNLREIIINIENFLKNDLISLNGLIKGMISFGSISIFIQFSIRYVKIIFLIIISPFAFLSMGHEITYGFFKMWIKLFFGNILIQIIVKLLLFIPIMCQSYNDNLYKVILVGVIHIIYRLNSFSQELFAKLGEKVNH